MGAADIGSGSIITLTSDFGLADAYVAAMKAVILDINPRTTLVDVSHDVRPQRLLQAVFITQGAWPFFPPGAIHVVVVDPGVGTERRALALITPRGAFLGPDNGVLSSALPDDARPTAAQGPSAAPLRAGYRAFAITSPRFMHEPVSATFHGRDVFAPAAAHLSLSVAPDELGDRVETLYAFPPLRAARCADGSVQAHVVHIDRFGNVVTDARADDLPEGALIAEVAGQRIAGLVPTYAKATGLAALVGSSGYLEVSLPNDSAAEALRVEIGDAVLVRPG